MGADMSTHDRPVDDGREWHDAREWKALAVLGAFFFVLTVGSIVLGAKVFAVICAAATTAMAFVAGYLLRQLVVRTNALPRFKFLWTTDDVGPPDEPAA